MREKKNSIFSQYVSDSPEPHPFTIRSRVTHNRLPIFQTEKLKEVVCNALNEARKSAGFLIFAYVIMPDHIHLLTDNAKSTSDTLRFANGITAKRVIDYLKENNFESCLAKLRIQVRDREHKHSSFSTYSNAFEIYGEDKMMEKVNYIHLNPVRARLVKIPDDYRFSSSRQWNGKEIEDEPLLTDHREIWWRSSKAFGGGGAVWFFRVARKSRAFPYTEGRSP